jgi:predicted transcriptional regulator
MKQRIMDLFEHASSYPEVPGFVQGSDTSIAAAARLESSAASMRARVVNYVRDNPAGVTCDEIEAALEMRHQTASARVREACLAGQIEVTADRRTTRSGSTARVYKVPAR